ncbi:MAG: DUF1080 domain-containing protein [Opitutaceae bacterium]|nr:DUF1080 domain-containing protein [Opitutaceae bacterium]
MMKLRSLSTILPLVLFAANGNSAVSTGNPFYGDAPDAHHPWAVHDRNRPQPKLITPGTSSTADEPGKPPSDAIVLFDGTAASLAQWEADKPEAGPTAWIVKDGAMECVPKSGYIRTKSQFGDCQLHVEWAAPANVQGDSQGRGNSGIFLMGLCEIQVLDNYSNPTYADGFAASVYGVNPPMANALRSPGQFQVIDIVFRRPIYRDGQVVDPGYVTVFCNGVLVQDHTPLEGSTGHLRRPTPRAFPDKGPLKLQDHGNPVRYRNIWYRELPPRTIEGGTDGVLTGEATMAKRKEIAASIRADAARMAAGSNARMLRLAESLYYEQEPIAHGEVGQMAERYATGLASLSRDQIEGRKAEILGVMRAFAYLAKFNVVPAGFAPLAALQKIEKAQGWDEDKKGKENANKKGGQKKKK